MSAYLSASSFKAKHRQPSRVFSVGGDLTAMIDRSRARETPGESGFSMVASVFPKRRIQGTWEKTARDSSPFETLRECAR
ncbi:hypothetical protein [Thioalkalivibrio sp. HK1]|uniref:hypothetical protein n=1 Tax=Thioalkalivibrio sp. HK1 TaxID=1469245 RepID=UPI0012DDB5AE|nr:hypothetical protein [Thioalkalivibrio sp. HK1]